MVEMVEKGKLIQGKYRLLHQIGTGGMGSVWEGIHERLRKKVAIKILLPEKAADKDNFARFVKEARIASAIGHRSIVEIHDMDVMEDGTPFIVMEFLEGRSLEDYLEEKGPLGAPETLDILIPVLEALKLAHEKGIVHRDLKPDNIYLHEGEQEREIKILDFGISMFAPESEQGSKMQSDANMGTPFYMSPEQAKGLKDIDRRTDIFSLGIIMYRCLAGRLPFDSDSYSEVFYKIVCRDPDYGRDFAGKGVPGHLINIVRKALEKDPEDRYRSCAEIMEAIGRYRRDLMKETTDLPPAELVTPVDAAPREPAIMEPVENKRLNIRSLILAAVVLALVAAVAAAGILSSRHDYKVSAVQNEDETTRTGGVRQESQQKSAGKEARLHLSFVPAGGGVYYDGVRIQDHPFLVKADGKTHTLSIKAGGYETFSTHVIPEHGSEDVFIQVDMVKEGEGETAGTGDGAAREGWEKPASGKPAEKGKVANEKEKTTLKKATHGTVIETTFE